MSFIVINIRVVSIINVTVASVITTNTNGHWTVSELSVNCQWIVNELSVSLVSLPPLPIVINLLTPYLYHDGHCPGQGDKAQPGLWGLANASDHQVETKSKAPQKFKSRKIRDLTKPNQWRDERRSEKGWRLPQVRWTWERDMMVDTFKENEFAGN